MRIKLKSHILISTFYQEILKEIDEDFTDEELDEVIAEIDSDKSTTIDFNEFVKLMTF